MTIQNQAFGCNTKPAYVEPDPPVKNSKEKPTPVSPKEFFQSVAVKSSDGVQAVVTAGADGSPNDHAWSTGSGDTAGFLAVHSAGPKPAYFSMAMFKPGAVSRWRGRATANVLALQGFAMDIEGSPKKYTKADGPVKGYPDVRAVTAAVRAFAGATSLVPNFLVFTGSGGVHPHYVLCESLSPAEWLLRARCLVTLAALHGLKIDAQCTTDAARIMRAPGSIHQDSGEVVQACQWRVAPYDLAEFDKAVGYRSGALTLPGQQPVRQVGHPLILASLGATGYEPFSYLKAAEQCGAMRQAAQDSGKNTSYHVWILAAKAASLSTEGPELAHSLSGSHAEYDAAKTDNKIASLTGGPAGCDAWANAYGVGGPCDACAYLGRIKNPAIQLGKLVDANPPGSVEVGDPVPSVPWVAEMNQRLALVRIGAKMIVVDFQTPCMTGRGVTVGMGYLDAAGFRAMFNGKFAPAESATAKPRPLADAWLSNPQRRQYDGLVYAPPPVKLADNILNLWQGFAVAPVPGDVSLWLAVLAALVPNESDRRYVLNWLAWKIQNPGGVPDTILIFKGAKGTGKNSLFDPLILLFGRHAMLADDPELIAGRFTWHLMYLSFAVLDEAVFIGDPRQADRITSRVTAKTMMYEQKGMDPVQGVNRCAYVILTNHEHAWRATADERRAVVVEVGGSLRAKLEFWKLYHAWAVGDGPAALLHYLQSIDLTGFNPRAIPKGEALRKQVEQTALRDPAAAWWHQCLTEGAVRYRENGVDGVTYLDDIAETEIDRSALRASYQQSAAGKFRNGSDWSAVAKRLMAWSGPTGIRKVKARNGAGREWRDVLPPLPMLRAAFTTATQVEVDT
jgi:hypothetical protein